LEGEVGKVPGRRPVFVNLKTIGAIFFFGSTRGLCQIYVVLPANGDQVTGQPVLEARVANLFHLRQEVVHDLVGLVARNQSIGDGHAIHEGEVVIMQLSVGALPAGQHAGGGIVERVVVNGAELLGACGIEVSVLGVFRLPGHFRHSQQGGVSDGVRVGVLVAKTYRVPPIGRPQQHPLAVSPRARVSAGGIFEQSFPIAIHSEHLGGPDLHSCIVLLQPRLVLAAAHVVPRGEHQRRIGVHEVVGQGRLTRVCHAVRRHATQVTVERLPDQIERGQAGRERGRPRGHGGILVDGKGTNVAGRIVGKSAVLGTQLENVQPVTPKTVEPGVVRKFRRARINGHHLQGVVDAGHGGRGRGKGNLHVVVRPFLPAKTLSIVAERQLLARVGSDSKRPLVGQMQKRREADASILVNEAKKCCMINPGVEIQHQWRRRAFFGIGGVQMYLPRREFKNPRRRRTRWRIGGPIFEPRADAP